MKKKLILFISLFLLLFSSVPSVYANELTKSFWTGGYWFGCNDVRFIVDFYLYALYPGNFTLEMGNLDTGDFHQFKIVGQDLYFLNGSDFIKIYDNMPSEVWLRLEAWYLYDKSIAFNLLKAKSGEKIITNLDVFPYDQPNVGIDPTGNIQFKLIPLNGSFAVSKVELRGRMRYFVFIDDLFFLEEFNDDTPDFDTFDLTGFNYQIVHGTKDSYLKIWEDVEPPNPNEKEEQPWWQKVMNQIWQHLIDSWNNFVSWVAGLLPGSFLDFFSWLWSALNWLWDMITLAFAMVLEFAPYFGLIILLGFLGACIDAFIEGSLDPLLNFIMFWYRITVSIITGIATVIQAIYNFIKIW